MSAALAALAVFPVVSRAVFKRCACSTAYTRDQFMALPWPGGGRRDVMDGLRLRNCSACHSTIAVPAGD